MIKNVKMKNIISIFVLSLISMTIFSQSSAYENGMKKGFEFWKSGEIDQAVALFERISATEDQKWVPPYYVATILISNSFSIQEMETREKHLSKAEEYLKIAAERSPENDEILTMNGLVFTSYVAMNPAEFGMKYSGKIMEFHERAIAINPENPRALANKIEYEMGFAKFMNQDLTPLCEKMKEIIPKFENQELREPFAPQNGIERAKQIIENCGI